MDLIGIIRDLRAEREKLEQIILSLEELQTASKTLTVAAGGRRGKHTMNADARMEVSRRMKKYWEGRRNGTKGSTAG